MGSVVGEKLTRLIERATEKELPVIIISTSGGARMYEGMFSLMQMAKTSAALAYHAQRRLPYISVLTHPTTAGVMASYASLGDLILAEPGAMIGFAGPRVIKDTTQAELPPGFQTAEFLLDHGLIDAIVPRREMKARLIQYLDFLTAGKKRSRSRRFSPLPSYHNCAASRLPNARPLKRIHIRRAEDCQPYPSSHEPSRLDIITEWQSENGW